MYLRLPRRWPVMEADAASVVIAPVKSGKELKKMKEIPLQAEKMWKAANIQQVRDSKAYSIRLTNLLDDDKVSTKIIHGGQTDKSSLTWI
ncbi:hypothetical protein Tco_1208349 [Tanacetum coccineum]